MMHSELTLFQARVEVGAYVVKQDNVNSLSVSGEDPSFLGDRKDHHHAHYQQNTSEHRLLQISIRLTK